MELVREGLISMNKPEPQSFSVNNAKEALNDMFNILPKSKKLEYIGNLNEILVVIGRLSKLANIEDEDKTL